MIDWSEINLKNYESALFNMYSWSNSAQKLYIAAKVLEPHVLETWASYKAHSKGEGLIKPDYYQGVYFMLIAYAVENILKAIVVSKDNSSLKQEFESIKKFPKLLKSKNHDLVDLCKKAEVTVSLEEENLLRRLSSRSSLWYSRYPAPLDYKDYRNLKKFSNEKEYNISGFSECDVDKINVLVKELFSFVGENKF